MGDQEVARYLLQQEPGRGNRHATAASNPKIAEDRSRRHSDAASYIVHDGTEGTFQIAVMGRLRWALERLIAAGEDGCTPLKEPAPRWSAYVADLRELGIHIETIREPHGGPYPGYHGRYVLRSIVTAQDEGGMP